MVTTWRTGPRWHRLVRDTAPRAGFRGERPIHGPSEHQATATLLRPLTHSVHFRRSHRLGLLTRVYFLFRDRDEGADRATIQQKHSPQVARVLSFIEDHVFEWRTVKQLAKHAGTSESSLLRAFHREVGASPAAYWRVRKLDVALDLLRAGTYSVTEVAERVGYNNPTAFSDAFRRRFGRAPSSFKPRASIRAAP